MLLVDLIRVRFVVKTRFRRSSLNIVFSWTWGEVEICRKIEDCLLYFSVLGILLYRHAYPVDVRAVKISGDNGMFFPDHNEIEQRCC